jgi:hypothetical protein
LWQWFIQIPRFVALNATCHTCPGRTSNVSIHNWGQAQPGVADLAGLVEIAAVHGRHPEGVPASANRWGIRVGVDQPQPHLGTRRRGVFRATVLIGEHDGAVECVYGQRQSQLPGPSPRRGGVVRQLTTEGRRVCPAAPAAVRGV